MNRLKNITRRENLRGIASGSLLKIAGAIVFAIILLVLFSSLSKGKDDTSDITNVAKPIAAEDINQEFSFPIKGSDGEEMGKIKYEITNAEIRDQIIIQGKKYASVDGRKIFVVSLKITNEFDQGIEINSRNYLRLSTNGNEEWLAPEYHNDPVTVQAISTKPTRVAFTVDQSAKDLVLQVGEIKGEKQKIEISITP